MPVGLSALRAFQDLKARGTQILSLSHVKVYLVTKEGIQHQICYSLGNTRAEVNLWR